MCSSPTQQGGRKQSFIADWTLILSVKCVRSSIKYSISCSYTWSSLLETCDCWGKSYSKFRDSAFPLRILSFSEGKNAIEKILTRYSQKSLINLVNVIYQNMKDSRPPLIVKLHKKTIFIVLIYDCHIKHTTCFIKHL